MTTPSIETDAENGRRRLAQFIACASPDDTDPSFAERPLRLWIERLHPGTRRVDGHLVSGSLRPGDAVILLPSACQTRVERLDAAQADTQRPLPGRALSVTLEDAAPQGQTLLAAPAERPEVADQFAAHLVWLGDRPMYPGRSYRLQIGASRLAAQITALKYVINPDTLEHVAARHLARHEVAFCNLSLERAVAFDPCTENPETGGFMLLEPDSEACVAYGMVAFGLRRASNIHRQATRVDKAMRASANDLTPCVLWFTGLSGAGKSTIADLVEQRLQALGKRTMLLDGDNVRHGLNRDLGFTDADRVENIRRVGEVSKLLVDAGLIVLVSFISPFRSERRMARELLDEDEFFEIFVDAPLEVCEARDPKGLYRKARAGKLPNFTGIGSPYEPPENPELRLAAGEAPPEALADQVVELLRSRDII